MGEGPKLRDLPKALMGLWGPPQRDPVWMALRASLRDERASAFGDLDALAEAARIGEVVAFAARVDPRLRASLAPDLERAIFVDLAIAQVEREVAEILGRIGPPALALIKGNASAHRLYPDALLRTRRDIDLLVDADAFPRATDALCAAGFRVTDTDQRPASDPRVRTMAMARDLPIGPVEVDLHRALVDPVRERRFTIDAKGILDRASMVNGAALPLASTPDLIVHTAIHAALNGFYVPLKSFLDLARWLKTADDAPKAESESELESESVAQRARAWNAKTVVWAAFMIVARTFSLPMPPAIAALKPAPAQAAVLSWLLDGQGPVPMRRPASKHAALTALSPLLADRPSATARHLIQRLGARIPERGATG